MTTEAMFERDGDLYVPTAHSLGPWGAKVLHGGPVAALLAFGIEQHSVEPNQLPVRISVDLFRAVPSAPLQLETRVLRDGSRVKAVEALLTAEGVAVSHASGLIARVSEEPAGDYAQTKAVTMPPPDQLPRLPFPNDPVTHATSIELRAAVRREGATMGNGVWVHVPYPVVSGTPLTPFTRAVTASDWANPVANMQVGGIRFVNADITVYLYRAPRGEWIGLEPGLRYSTDGVGLSDCALLDGDGPAGRSITASLASRTAVDHTKSARPEAPA